MGKVVNLRQARKQRDRAEKERDAAENRVRFGRSGTEKAALAREQARKDALLQGKKLDDAAGRSRNEGQEDGP